MRAPFLIVLYCSFSFSQNSGTPYGFLTDCPGWNSSTIISPETLRTISVTVHRTSGARTYRKMYRFPRASSAVIRDPNVDLVGKRTLVFFDGYLDSVTLPHNRALADAYSRRDYNVIQLQSWSILLRSYPVAARLTKPLGTLMGDFLADLYKAGLNPASLDLLGISLGSHTVAVAAERFRELTTRRPARITGLDPAGPCFRDTGPELSIRPSLADRVDVLHTNIDGFGTAQPLGHVDFYANGGEYQPSSIEGFLLPCLTICSHIRSFLYWWMAVENPEQFLASRCDSVQDARRGNCYGGERVRNVLGPDTDFNKTGIFYLPTRDVFPYYAGIEGLEQRYKPTSFLRSFVPKGDLVI